MFDFDARLPPPFCALPPGPTYVLGRVRGALRPILASTSIFAPTRAGTVRHGGDSTIIRHSILISSTSPQVKVSKSNHSRIRYISIVYRMSTPVGR